MSRITASVAGSRDGNAGAGKRGHTSDGQPGSHHARSTERAAADDELPSAAPQGTRNMEAVPLLKHGLGKSLSADGILTDMPGLTEAEAALVQRFDPAGPRDTIGFFVAKFVKVALLA